MKECGIILGVAISMVIGWSGAVQACLAEPRPHRLDPSEVAVDKNPPSAPTVTINSIKRGKGPERSLLGARILNMSGLDGFGSIMLVLEGARDDRTDTRSMGYRIHFVDGTLPDGCVIESGAFRASTLPDRWVRDMGRVPGYPLTTESLLRIHWIDGATDDQEEFDFKIAVSAVDLAGNESELSQVVRVAHPGK